MRKTGTMIEVGVKVKQRKNELKKKLKTEGRVKQKTKKRG